MRESQAEIKAIAAQLSAIRVDSSLSQRAPSIALKPSSTHLNPQNPMPLSDSSQVRHGQNPTASSTVPSRRPTEFPVSAKPAQSNSFHPNPAHTKHVEGYPLPPKYRLPNHLEATIDRLQQQSTAYVQQFRQLQSQSFQTPEQLLEQALKVLESQVQHINQLSAVQENALLELKTIAEQVEYEWKTIEQSHPDTIATELDSLPICEYLGAAVPQIERNRDGIYVLSARSIDLFKAEREATLTAEALRHWANRRNPVDQPTSPFTTLPRTKSPSIWQRLTHFLSPTDSHRSAPAKSRFATQSAQQPSPTALSQPSQAARRVARSRQQRAASHSVLRLKEAVALFLGAVVARALLDMVLVSFPMLWTPAIALLVTPAAIAVYRSSHTPQSGLVWGYRLLIIMIGLLIGGRL